MFDLFEYIRVLVFRAERLLGRVLNMVLARRCPPGHVSASHGRTGVDTAHPGERKTATRGVRRTADETG